ncbi:4'-phosphopantetheinyl transferase superfamily protein [Streptomyces sp. NPDC089799]|uniref:4'-phosphopantetheinyl transferase family protein n=1 Tax=Streptomyces sp. NPDC089799 TaxID=3155066 RepID=UPI0034300C09
MLKRILPSGVAVVESFGDPPEAVLYPEEALLVRNAVEKRRKEFTTVRYCARRALGQLGLPPGPVLPDRWGAPCWPATVVGSLTHCEGYRAAALAYGTDVTMLGIDAEPHAPLPRGTLEAVASPAERMGVRSAPAGTHWDRLLFSAKESVYKAWYPHTGQRLEFEDAEIGFEPAAGTFRARLLVRPEGSGPRSLPSVLRGRWLVRDGLVVTVVAVTPGRQHR